MFAWKKTDFSWWNHHFSRSNPSILAVSDAQIIPNHPISPLRPAPAAPFRASARRCPWSTWRARAPPRRHRCWCRRFQRHDALPTAATLDEDGWTNHGEIVGNIMEESMGLKNREQLWSITRWKKCVWNLTLWMLLWSIAYCRKSIPEYTCHVRKDINKGRLSHMDVGPLVRTDPSTGQDYMRTCVWSFRYPLVN